MISLPAKRGLLEHLRAQGWVLRTREGLWTGRNPSGADDEAGLAAAATAYDELPAVKRDKSAAIKSDGLARIRAVFPAIDDFDMLKLVVNIMQSILPAARQPTPDMLRLQAIWQAGQDAIAAVNAATSAAQVEAVVPAWP